jgi:ABC-type antimicrobial peptide transport system permease subunit
LKFITVLRKETLSNTIPLFATFSKSPFTSNIAIFSAAVLGIPGFLVGRWLLVSAKHDRRGRRRN